MAESNGHPTALPPWIPPILRSFQSVTSRLGLSHKLGSTHGGMRDMETLFGYKERLSYLDFKQVYERNGLGQRIVTVWPEETWSQPPEVMDEPDVETPTPFTQAWTALDQRLALYATLAHADMLAQLGHYGCVLVGLAGQDNLAQPATPVRQPDEVLYLETYSEELMHIEAFGADASQPTYGKPVLYRLLSSASTASDSALRRPVRSGQVVHASRVLHIPGQRGLDDPRVYGLPILEAVYNDLVDLLKVTGGAAEMFWRGAQPRFGLAAREGYTLSAEEADRLTQEADEFVNMMRQFMRVQGIDITHFPVSVASPGTHFEIIMQRIASLVRVPMRKLLGSEVGQLASTQDEHSFLSQKAIRQVNYAETMALRPCVDWLVGLVTTLEPTQRVTVRWPNAWSLSEMQQAEVMKNRAQAAQAALTAAATFTGPGLVNTLLSAEEVRGVLGPVWQMTETELTPELPPEVEEQLLLLPEPGEMLDPPANEPDVDEDEHEADAEEAS